MQRCILHLKFFNRVNENPGSNQFGLSLLKSVVVIFTFKPSFVYAATIGHTWLCKAETLTQNTYVALPLELFLKTNLYLVAYTCHHTQVTMQNF